MKRKLQSLFLACFLVLVMASAACAPQFFTATNTDMPGGTHTSAFSFTGYEGFSPFQGVIAPGTLCIGALPPTQSLQVALDLGGSTTAELEVWDGSTYLVLNSTNETAIEGLLADLIVLTPDDDTSLRSVDIDLSVAGHPKVYVDFTDAMALYESGTIWQLSIPHEVNDVHIFRVYTSYMTYMTADRVVAVRQGDGDGSANNIQAVSIVYGETITDGCDTNFTVSVNKPQGNLQMIIVTPHDTATTDDNKIYPMAVVNATNDGDTINYELYRGGPCLEDGATHYLLLFQKLSSTVPDRDWSIPDMVISQDMNGGMLGTGMLFTAPYDLAAFIGGSDTNLIVRGLRFQTPAP